MGMGMEGVGWGEPTGTPGGPLGLPLGPLGPPGAPGGPGGSGGADGGGRGRALIHGFPISPLGSPILHNSLFSQVGSSLI